ncbi:hypothetical protein SUGI_0631470 [Cryptomeria japonica]|nr:hypothetical protein SUGI_0631470 [Cryptomeria japonica]
MRTSWWLNLLRNERSLWLELVKQQHEEEFKREFLAMDKSNAICGKRLASIGLENTKAKCQAYHQLLVSTSSLGKYISGAILFVLTQFEEQAESLVVIITMSGRPMHHLAEVDEMSLQTMEYLLFDKANHLPEMGFAEQL